MLHRTTGDLLELAREGDFDVIVHGCNCFCTMGKGIAKQIKDEYPAAYAADCLTYKGDIGKMGRYSFCTAAGFDIVNAYTQYTYNRAGENNKLFSYISFGKVLNSLKEKYAGKRFGFPYIGMGLAGGNKERIFGMLEKFAEEIEATGGSVTIVEHAKF
jgi:O-acetyl-ADP-ribose deacetylase (regulator of RNase III)